jgi:hypothetical protein
MNLAKLRLISNYGLIINTTFGIYWHFQWSLGIGVLLSALSVPFYSKAKLWDTVAFITFMMAVNFSGFIYGTPGCDPKF